MPNWIQRVGALFGSRAAAAQVAAPSVAPVSRVRIAAPAPVVDRAPPTAAESPAAAGIENPDPQVPFFEWLLGAGPTFDAPLLPAEKRSLARLDTLLAADASRAELLPRAPAVIPQLMNCLRDESQSTLALAERVEKDPNLVAEVLRLANSSAVRGEQRVADLPRAIGRLGTQGLRRAIAKVVLKPIFDAHPTSLSGRAAPRLWMHSEAKAAECMRLAGQAGLDPFEGYLAGLMHNIGWTAALRALDQTEAGAQANFTRAFVAAFEARREMFFALLVMPWQLTDILTALAVELSAGGGLAATRSPLGLALQAADRSASWDVLDVDIPLEVAAVPA